MIEYTCICFLYLKIVLIINMGSTVSWLVGTVKMILFVTQLTARALDPVSLALQGQCATNVSKMMWFFHDLM